MRLIGSSGDQSIATELEQLQQWVGRSECVDDVVSAAPIRALAATLDLADGQDLALQALRPCWHWLYFLPIARQSQIGDDGHPQRGSFLPPVPLPRRMWAGSQIEFLAPLRVGDAIRRVSRIADVSVKEGRTGPLVFVKVDHEVESAGTVCIRERSDIVYRDISATVQTPGEVMMGPVDAEWCREIVPGEVLLFRYSALTFNGHRIHYDRPFATGVEAYPGLVVHGPLIATMLLDLLHRERPNAQVRRFSFKAVKPIFDTAPFKVCGRMEGDHRALLWAVGAAGDLAMQAEAEIA